MEGTTFIANPTRLMISALSHVNDAGFWLVGTFLEIDEKTTLKSWTINVENMEVILCS